MNAVTEHTALELIDNEKPAQPLVMQPHDNSQGAVMLRMIEAAVMRPDFDVEKMKALMEMKRQFDADEARRAYTAAMADFKRNAPTIIKDKHVKFTTQKGITEYDHATLGNVVKTIVAGLSEHGLSSAWNTERKDGRIHVTCTVTHRLGHGESVTLDGSPDESGGKNAIQAIGSTVSYLQRYTLLAITGLATEDQDDDGAGSDRGEPAEDPVMQGFRDAALQGEAALRAHYEANVPSDEFWSKNSRLLKAAAKTADEQERARRSKAGAA